MNKGNFLTAYLLAHPGCRVVHIGRNLDEQDFKLSHQIDTLRLGGYQFNRHRLEPQPLSIQEPWDFRQKRSLPIDMPGEEEGIWLDIDLDYFCNRYDGDSDRSLTVALPNERGEVMQRVELFLNELHKATWLTRIEAVSIAVSPGFFPTEYWAEVLGAVRSGIRSKLEA